MHWAQRRGKWAAETELRVWDPRQGFCSRQSGQIVSGFEEKKKTKMTSQKLDVSEVIAFSLCRKMLYLPIFSHFLLMWQLWCWATLTQICLLMEKIFAQYILWSRNFSKDHKYREGSQVPNIMDWHHHCEERRINKRADTFKSNTQLQVQKKER